MLRVMLVGLIALACLSSAAQAVPAAVRQACMSDAIKFCDSVIHDAAKRRACMRSHRAELSTRCIEAVRKSRGGGPRSRP
jgi:hypothetical protein